MVATCFSPPSRSYAANLCRLHFWNGTNAFCRPALLLCSRHLFSTSNGFCHFNQDCSAMGPENSYCASRFTPTRRISQEVNIGELTIGGNQPVRVQSMTTTDTLDIKSTVDQTIELAEAGCEIVRITAPNIRRLKPLRRYPSKKGGPNQGSLGC